MSQPQSKDNSTESRPKVGSDMIISVLFIQPESLLLIERMIHTTSLNKTYINLTQF